MVGCGVRSGRRRCIRRTLGVHGSRKSGKVRSVKPLPQGSVPHQPVCNTRPFSAGGLSASFPSVVHRCKFIHTLKFRFSLTSNSGRFSPVMSTRYDPHLLPNGRASPTKRTERLLPNGLASPTKRTGVKNPLRFCGLTRALPVKRGRPVGRRRCCGVGLLPNGRACFLPNGRRSPTKRTGQLPTERADFLPLLVNR
jgi:hypothetical protein